MCLRRFITLCRTAKMLRSDNGSNNMKAEETQQRPVRDGS